MPSIYRPYHGDRTSEHEFPGSELTPAAVEFGRAMERYKRQHDRPYPSWSEVLYVATRILGYRKEPRCER